MPSKTLKTMKMNKQRITTVALRRQLAGAPLLHTECCKKHNSLQNLKHGNIPVPQAPMLYVNHRNHIKQYRVFSSDHNFRNLECFKLVLPNHMSILIILK